MRRLSQGDSEKLKKEILWAPFLIWVGVFLTICALINEVMFYMGSKQAMSSVVSVASFNSVDCYSRKGLASIFGEPLPCTRFNAIISYRVGDEEFKRSIDAGYERMHDVLPSHALYQTGQPLEIRYKISEPSVVTVNTFMLLFTWTFVFGITTLFMVVHYMYKRNKIREIDNLL